MNFRTTLVLLALAATLGAYVYFFERGEVPDPNKIPDISIFDEKFEAKDVQKLELTAQDGVGVGLERAGDAWKLTQPAGARADKATADGAAKEVAGLVASRKIDKVADLASLGLDKPRNKLDILLQGKTTPRTLLFGEKTIDGRSIYAKRADAEAIFLLPSSIEAQLTRKLPDWRDKNLTGVDFPSVTGLEIERGGVKLAFEKRGERWFMTSPIQLPAAPEQVEGFIRDTAGLRVDSFVKDGASEEELKGYGLDATAAKVRLKVGETASVQLLLGSLEAKPEATPAPTVLPGMPEPPPAAPSKMYAKLEGEPSVCLVPGTLTERLAKKAEDYYFLKPFATPQWMSERAEIRLEDLALVVQKNDKSEWQIVEPSGKKGGFDLISPVQNAAFGLTFDGLAEGNPQVEEKAKIVVSREKKEGEANALAETLILGPKLEDGTRLVQRQGEAWVYRMKDTQLDALRAAILAALADPTPTPAPATAPSAATPAPTP